MLFVFLAIQWTVAPRCSSPYAIILTFRSTNNYLRPYVEYWLDKDLPLLFLNDNPIKLSSIPNERMTFFVFCMIWRTSSSNMETMVSRTPLTRSRAQTTHRSGGGWTLCQYPEQQMTLADATASKRTPVHAWNHNPIASLQWVVLIIFNIVWYRSMNIMKLD